jgi:hypothetical protein
MMMLLAVHALYVGNSVCAPCHAELVRSYNATPMAQSSGRVTGNLPAGSFHDSASDVEYRVEPSGVVHMRRGAAKGERRLDYFIGSGAAGRSYLSSYSVSTYNSFVYEAPITWYSRESRWAASPGYEGDRSSRWSRAVEPDCLNCHASQIRSAADYANLYADPPFAQNGIGCERCHGPGSEHAAGKSGMTNPAKLEPARRDAICAQCHMSGEVRVDRSGRRLADYRPGDLISDYVAYFVRQGGSGVKATGYVEKLAASRCKLASGDRMWCGSCHDPHRVPAPAERISFYREKCLSCHAIRECGRGEQCIECHMPKAQVVDVSHGVLTDHSIPRLPGAKTPGVRSSWVLEPFSPSDRGDRELGLAYAEMFARTNDARQGKEAMRLLFGSLRDDAVQTRLAGLYRAQGQATQASAVYRALLKKNPKLAVALVNLGESYGSSGHLDEAIALWREALKVNPCLEEAGTNLRIALQARSDAAGLDALSKSRSFCEFP